MRYSIIGTGNTAWFMAKKLFEAGTECVAVYGRDMAKATALADEVNSTGKSLDAGVQDDADVCIMAISDHAIAEVCKSLSLKNTILCHTAGAVGIEVLQDAAINYGVLWPVYSITKNNLPQTRQIPTVYETNNAASQQLLLQVANSFTDIVYNADSAQRQMLHLTAVFSNNFSNHLFSIAKRICDDQQLPFSLLLPIIQQTVSRIENNSPETTQTGPAKRGDTETQEKHLQLLQQHTDWQEIYKAVSASIAEMHLKKN
ncbi:hypothetical protein CAP35_08670 [Chitinophagaceae bacterium IBVUCB1]|nr:hypothetical protein CAP35_08670 [Chitinophagaceae bacterium IBVUCB1]